MGELRNSYNILVRCCDRKGPLWTPRHRWEINIIMYPKEMVYEECVGSVGGLLELNNEL
jgi:hypothetical protein